MITAQLRPLLALAVTLAGAGCGGGGAAAPEPAATTGALDATPGAPPAIVALDRLAVVIDRDHALFVSSRMTDTEQRELTWGDNRAALATFEPIDATQLAELVAAAFRANPSMPLTLWVDPNAKPLGWPPGWQADTDLLDPGAYLQMLVERARRDAGIAQPSSWRPAMLSLPFPPAVPVKIGSHARDSQ